MENHWMLPPCSSQTVLVYLPFMCCWKKRKKWIKMLRKDYEDEKRREHSMVTAHVRSRGFVSTWIFQKFHNSTPSFCEKFIKISMHSQSMELDGAKYFSVFDTASHLPADLFSAKRICVAHERNLFAIRLFSFCLIHALCIMNGLELEGGGGPRTRSRGMFITFFHPFSPS